jgi:hypothetical protein
MNTEEIQKHLASATAHAMKACSIAASWSAKTFEQGTPGSSSFSLLTAAVALCGVGLMMNAYASLARGGR